MHLLFWFLAAQALALAIALSFCRAARHGDEALDLRPRCVDAPAVDLLRDRLLRQARSRT
jgi:hypothetical protein